MSNKILLDDRIKELKLQLNYVCYDKNMIAKLDKVWEAFFSLEQDAEQIIQKRIDKAEERGFFTKLRTSGCYSRKETKTLVDKARDKTAREIIEWIEGQGTVEYINHGEPCEVYEVTPSDIDQLKAKYIKE